MISRLMIETYDSKSPKKSSPKKSSESAQLGGKRSESRDRRGIQRWGGSTVRAGKAKHRKNRRRREVRVPIAGDGEVAQRGRGAFFKKKKIVKFLGRRSRSGPKPFWANWVGCPTRKNKLFDEITILNSLIWQSEDKNPFFFSHIYPHKLMHMAMLVQIY